MENTVSFHVTRLDKLWRSVKFLIKKNDLRFLTYGIINQSDLII